MGILEYAILGKQAGSGGSGGGSGAKLYRHDIEIEDGQESGTTVYITVYNADSRNYTSELDYDYDECCYIGSHPEGAFNFIPLEYTPAGGWCEGDGVIVVMRWEDEVWVRTCGFSEFSFTRHNCNIFDHITQIL